jgi:hypothetical protein
VPGKRDPLARVYVLRYTRANAEYQCAQPFTLLNCSGMLNKKALQPEN